MNTLLLDAWLETLEDKMPLKQEIQALKDALAQTERELSDVRELLADDYVELSGKSVHASDCATSNAPAFTPGKCDCDAIEALKDALEKAEHELAILKPKLDEAAGFNLHELVIENDNQSLENFTLKEKLSVAQAKLGEKVDLEDVGELMQHRKNLIAVASQALERLQNAEWGARGECPECYHASYQKVHADDCKIVATIQALKKELGE